MAPNNSLCVDVYVTPAYAAATGDPNPLKQRWSPTSCTLVHGRGSAIIVDVPPTVFEAEKLADWIAETIPGKAVDYFLATHAHGDHFLGFPVLEKRFPGIKFLATAAVKEGIEQQLEPTYFKAVWEGWFPQELGDKIRAADVKVLPVSGALELDGFQLRVYDVVQGDSANNSFLHVPPLDLIVAGDLVYGDCYQYLAEANTKQMRADWVRSVEQIESLKPKIVVPGHTRASQLPGAYMLETTKEYIRTFEVELEKAESAEELYKRIQALYPERWNLFILEISCQASFANKGK